MNAARVGLGIAVAGAIVIAAATLYPTPGTPTIPHVCVVCGTLGGVDAVLNVLLFIPLGLGLGVRKTRWGIAAGVVLAATLLVELLQLTVVTGRSATLGDLLTNTLGGSLGYFVGSRWRSAVFPRNGTQIRLGATAALIFCALMTLTGYSLQPSPTTGTFFGHHVRRHGDEPAFPGTVRSAFIGNCAIQNWTIDNRRCVSSPLIRGDTFAIEVVARGTTPVPSAIVRVVDERQNEIAMLGADRERAIFSVRTRAAAMALRPYRFAIDSVFVTDAPHTVRLAGTFNPSAATILAWGSGRARRTELRLGPASGWRLFIPFRYYDDGSSRAPTVDVVWLALLLVPVGYWSIRSEGSASGRLQSALLIPLLVGGLLIGPLGFGTAAPSLIEVLGGIAGLAAGAGARRILERVNDTSPAARD